MANEVLPKNAVEWLANGERGISSEVIFNVITGYDTGVKKWGCFSSNYPRDPDDFKRCEYLFRQVPEFRNKINTLKELGGPWKKLVENWNKIVKMLDKEIPGLLDRKVSRGSAPKTYKFMKSLGC